MQAFESGIRWCEETQTLTGWVEVNGRNTFVTIPRDMIHTVSIYNDAVGWEIERFKLDIVERLKPHLSIVAVE